MLDTVPAALICCGTPGRGERVSGSSQETGIPKNIPEQLSPFRVSPGMPTFDKEGVRTGGFISSKTG